jgi:hypothetical protein
MSSRFREAGILRLTGTAVLHYCYTTILHIMFVIAKLPFEFHFFNSIMSEGRRGRRPPLPPSNALVIPVENAEGAPSTASDDEEVPLFACRRGADRTIRQRCGRFYLNVYTIFPYEG